MPDSVTTPFAALSLIVAPVILTNASSVLAMSMLRENSLAVDVMRERTRLLRRHRARAA
jgi:hypothetical protein